MRLADLAGEIIVSIFVHLDARTCITVASRVSQTWTISKGRQDVWRSLELHHNISMPRAHQHSATTSRNTRSEVDVRRAFVMGMLGLETARRERANEVLSSLNDRMSRGELKEKQLALLAETGSNCGWEMHDNWTAAHIAAFHGRLSTLQTLILHHGASLTAEDDGALTPFAIAAWSGEAEVVEWILNSGMPFGGLFQRGMPSSTSLPHKASARKSDTARARVKHVHVHGGSARGGAAPLGGSEPLTPHAWALHNGFESVAFLIEAHAAQSLESMTSAELAGTSMPIPVRKASY